MVEIVPAIIGKDFTEVKEKAEKVAEFVSWIHIDVVDGVFASPATWPYDQGGPATSASQIRFLKSLYSHIKIELHLMTQNPENDLRAWMDGGVDRIIFHYEATEHHHDCLLKMREGGIQSGIALKFETPHEVLLSFASQLESQLSLVQCMTIDSIGTYGRPFRAEVLEKVKSLRAIMPNVTISSDGGIDIRSAKLAIEAGSGHLVIGSAIFRESSAKEAIKAFKSLG